MSELRPLSAVTDQELLAAVTDAPSMLDLIRLLAVAGHGDNYAGIRLRLERLGALPDHLRRRPPPRFTEVSDDALAAAVAEATTLADALRTLGYEPLPGMYRPLARRIQAAAIDVTHLRGRGWSRGTRKEPVPLEQMLAKGSGVHSSRIRVRLLQEGLMESVCACCGLSEWRGRPIPLELDHINGDRTDNRLENLRLLCPNCHAQTDTYRGRNIGRPVGIGRLLLDPEDEFSGQARLDLIMRRTG